MIRRAKLPKVQVAEDETNLKGVRVGNASTSIATSKRRTATTAIGRWADVESSDDDAEQDVNSLDDEDAGTKEECRISEDMIS